MMLSRTLPTQVPHVSLRALDIYFCVAVHLSPLYEDSGRDWTYRGIRIVGNRFENIQSDSECVKPI